jgi:hypothetical protein
MNIFSDNLSKEYIEDIHKYYLMSLVSIVTQLSYIRFASNIKRTIDLFLIVREEVTEIMSLTYMLFFRYNFLCFNVFAYLSTLVLKIFYSFCLSINLNEKYKKYEYKLVNVNTLISFLLLLGLISLHYLRYYYITIDLCENKISNILNHCKEYVVNKEIVLEENVDIKIVENEINFSSDKEIDTIMFVPYDNGDVVLKMIKCEHYFRRDGITTWFLKQYPKCPSCPVCREEQFIV